MYLLTFFLLLVNFYFFFTAFHFGPTSLLLFIYLLSSLSSPVSIFTPLFRFASLLLLFVQPVYLYLPTFFTAFSGIYLYAPVSFFFSSPLFVHPVPKPASPLRRLYLISKNQANGTATLLQKGGVSRTMARPFIGCHSHIHATY